MPGPIACSDELLAAVHPESNATAVPRAVHQSALVVVTGSGGGEGDLAAGESAPPMPRHRGLIIVAAAGRLLTLLLSNGTIFVLALLLSLPDLGGYFLSASVAAAIGVFAQFGLGQAWVRQVGRELADERGHAVGGQAGAVLLLMVLASAGLGTVLLAIADQLRQMWPSGAALSCEHILLTTVWGLCTSLQGFLAEAFRARSRILLSVVFGGLLSGAASTIFSVTYWSVTNGLLLGDVLWIQVISVSASVLGGAACLGMRLPVRGDWKLPREFWTTAIAAWTASVLFILIRQVDIWLLSAYVSSEELATYGFVVKLAELAALPLLVVNMVMPPFIAVSYASSKLRELEAHLRSTATFAFVASILIACTVLVAGDWLFVIFLGTSTLAGWLATTVLVVGQLVNVYTGSCGFALLLSGRGLDYSIVAMISLGFLSLAGMIAAYHRSIVLMACAVSAAHVLTNLAWLWRVRKTSGLTTSAQPFAILGFVKRSTASV